MMCWRVESVILLVLGVMQLAFLITTKEEMINAGLDQIDIVLISGDAYVDHPSFGVAIISRVLEAHGYTVAILAQPDYKKKEDFMQFGQPRLAFMITAGNIDSMVNHYSVAKKRRQKDNYTDQGEMGKRPDRATIVYSQMVKRLYPKTPIILGGIEASLRRLAHYDYWDDRVRQSVLIDSQADLLIYGMAENTVVEVTEALDAGLPVKDIIYVRGTVWKTRDITYVNDAIVLPSYQEICADKRSYAKSYQIQHEHVDAIIAKTLIEPSGDIYLVQNPPALPLTRQEMDFVYQLPYMRTFHPKYQTIPAIEEVRFSVISNRGCFGSCSFCALTHHQGRVITSRSKDSIVEEAKRITQDKEFKGYIHDVGGPTANFHQPSCLKQIEHGTCAKQECLHPKACKNLRVSHEEYLEVLRELRTLPKVKKIFVRSGIRYDYLMYDKDDSFFRELVQHHISGQLKVAPEHVDPQVLDKMGKPRKELYEKFVAKYESLNQTYNKNQFLVPYLMSSHPGSDLDAAISLALYLKKIKHTPQQVQDFYPTPATRSTCMYYTGIDPLTMQEVYVPKTPREKAMQRALMQFTYPQNYDLVAEALKEAGRQDLIGFHEGALIRPRQTRQQPAAQQGGYQKHNRKSSKGYEKRH